MKKRSLLIAVCVLCAVSFLTACGKNYYFAGRNLPPSGVLNRVLVAVQNPSPLTKGALYFDDALYDVRHSYDGKVPLFSIGGFAGQLPLTIQNMPEQQLGAVYSVGDGSLALIDYGGEKVKNTVANLNGASQSVFISHDGNYVYAASQTAHSLTVVDNGTPVTLNLPGVYRVSMNPGNTVVLAFIQNSNDVYSVVHLTQAQQTEAQRHPIGYVPSNVPNAQPSVDCEPQALPSYCVFPVATQGSATFDHPIKAIFSPDGTTAYVLNCGPECGGTASGITTIPITAGSLNPDGIGAAGIALTTQNYISVPGGATNGAFDASTLYVAGQQLQSDGLFAGVLTVVDTLNRSITGQYSISDGTHNKMILADDNTLWIGSYQCQSGERYKLSQTTAPETQFGCITMFNTANHTVQLESFKGDGTGIAAVTGLHKVYTTEGGQVYIYNTTDGTSRDNFNVTVTGTAYDVAYMDAVSDANNTTY